jgi:hypothetical protein
MPEELAAVVKRLHQIHKSVDDHAFSNLVLAEYKPGELGPALEAAAPGLIAQQRQMLRQQDEGPQDYDRGSGRATGLGDEFRGA